jgi:beta-galactosidase
MGAGFPPYFPPLSERDSEFTLLSALAYGLRGFNVYMAVERDRWIGAPVDRHGRPRPFAERWRKLCAALDEVGFERLRRHVPVRLVVPRIERRLARVMHAFGPATGALFSVMGQGARESCIEDDLGLGYPLAIEADTFVRSFEQALDARGVPYAHASGEDRDILVAGASWILCATSGAFADSLAVELAAAAAAGTRVTLGPRPRRFDGAMRALGAVDPLAGVEVLERADPATADAAVARALEELQLPRYASDPDGIHVTVHHDPEGELSVAFVINASDSDLVARVTLGVDGSWRDLLEGGTTRSADGLLELRVKPHSVRMLARA